MLIGICGGLCAGKNTIAQYLVDHHGFTRLTLGFSTFPTAADLLDHATSNWPARFVTTSITTLHTLQTLRARPFFMLISVDAPVALRYTRYVAREADAEMTLEKFVQLSDSELYDMESSLATLTASATLRLLNTSQSLASLYATLGKLDLPSPDRLRPSWDLYFMSLAALASERSNCMKRRVGCVLVGPSKRVISTGYNGTPRGLVNCGDGGCPRCNSGGAGGVALNTCLCLHAEENALLEAGRDRIREGSVLYCDTCPCLTCSIKICQVGIAEVVYSQGYSMDDAAAEIFRNARVRLRQFVPPTNGVVHLEMDRRLVPKDSL